MKKKEEPNMKKSLALLLALCMMLGMAIPGFAEEAKDSWLCDEKTTLTVCTYDGVSQAFPTIGNDLRFWQWLEDYTNVHIEWQVHSNADYATVKAAKMAAGEIDTDIINLGDSQMAMEGGMSGLFVNIADYLETCAPHALAYAANDYPAYIDSMTSYDGAIWYLGGSVSPDLGHILICYNTAWMEQLGAEVPTTLDEFTELCRQMKGVDFNGNGEADEIILTTSSVDGLQTIATAFGLEAYEDTTNFAAVDGVVHSEMISQEYKDFLTYANMLFEEGILDPGIAKTSPDEMSQKIAQDKVGIFIYYSAFSMTYGQLTTAGQADPLGEHYTMGGPLLGPNGDQYYMLRNRAATDLTCVSAQSENIELAIRWLDTLINDPVVIRTRCCGFEGETYELDENGEVQLIYPEDGSAWNISEYGCGQIAMPHHQTYDQLMNSRRNVQWYMDQYNALLDPYCFIAPSVPTNVPSFAPEEQDLFDMVRSDCDDYYREMRAKFITGEADIEAEWDAYVETLQALGLDDYTAAWQMVYDRVNG